MQRWDIINHFIKKYNYKNYLEIGYYKGWSFDQVECDWKMAVDPNPCKTPEQEKWDKSTDIYHHGKAERKPKGLDIIYKMTSDDFFSQLSSNSIWDIIFIDGLHESKQVLKDVQNSLNHLSPGGIIIMHDCNPPKYEHTTTGIDGCWTGDVYKAYIDVKYNPNLVTYVVDTDWGVGVIKKMKIPDNLSPAMKVILRGDAIGVDNPSIYEWDHFDNNRKSLLNLISVEEFLDKEK